MPTQKDTEDAGFSRIDAPDGKSSMYVFDHDLAMGGERHGRPGLEPFVNAQVDVMKGIARRKGIELTPELELLMRERAVEDWNRFEREMRAKGVPAHIQQLLDAVTKRDGERLAADMTITSQDFSRLIFNARTHLGYRYRLKVKEFHPAEHERFSDDISEAMKDIKPGPASPELVKAMRKMHAMFEERKRVHAHMFEKGTKWHCFFFDLNDMTDPEQGPHIHYISHRWTLDRDEVLAAFDERRHSLPRRVHIRYLDPKLEESILLRNRPAPTSGHVLRVDPAPEKIGPKDPKE